MSTGRRAWDELARRARTGSTVAFGDEVTDRLPPAARRYLAAAVAPGTPLAPAARLEMHGRIKIGRWLPFRAHQLLAPRHGTVWMATVGGVIRGSDRFVGGTGGMTWKLLGLLPLVRAEGPDVSRSAAERAAGESIWVPTAVAADATAAWSAATNDELDVTVSVEDHTVTLHHSIDAEGRLRSSCFSRWGDPDRTGTWSEHPFGVEVTGHRTFDGVTIPNAGRAGWHLGTDRWDDGAFFEFDITGYELLRPG
jgi:hypothetical protein